MNVNCENFADMLDNYACLSDEELRELEAHSQQCGACASELDFMRSILASAKSLPPIEPPSDFLDSVNSRLDDELAKETPVKRFMRRSRPYASKYGAVAACVAIAAAVSVNAGTLISRMNSNGDGVISEQRTVSDNIGTDEKPAAAFMNEGENTAEPIQEISEAASGNESAAPAELKAPDTLPDIPALAATPAPANDRRSASVVSASALPAAPARTAPIPTRAPYASPQPAASGSEKASETAVQTAVPQAAVGIAEEKEVITPAPAVNATAQPAAEEHQTYEIAQNIINSADKYASVSQSGVTEEDYETGIDAELSDYTLANLGTEQASTYASLSSTISVKAKDIARVHELVDVFVNGVYGNYYMITAQDMNGLLGQFDREGIWYSANITESGDRISFKLITMQMD